MKPHRAKNCFTLSAAFLAATLVQSTSLFAANYYWDINGSTAGAGGPTPNGAWNGTNAFWNSDSAGGAGSLIASPTSGDNLFLSAGADATGGYTLTITGSPAASSITTEDGTPTLSFGSNMTATNFTINTPTTFKFAGSGTRDLEGRWTGTGVAAGTNALIIDAAGGTLRTTASSTLAANNFTGDVRVIAGFWAMQNRSFSAPYASNVNLTIPDASSVTVDSGATWQLVWGEETIGGLNGSGIVDYNGGTTFQTKILTVGGGDRNGSFNGTMNHLNMGLDKIGTGTQELSGTGISFDSGSRTTTITGGVLKLTDTTAWNSSVTVTNPGTLQLNSTTGTWTYANKDISGNGAVLKSGAGAVTLAQAKTFTGDLTVNGGILKGTAAGAFGSASNTRTLTVESGATLDFGVVGMYGGHNSVNVPNLVINGGTVTNSGSGNNPLNNVTLNGGTLTATTDNGATWRSWDINGTITSTGTSTISSGTAANPGILLNSAGTNTNVNVQSGTLTISTFVGNGRDAASPFAEHATSLTKQGAGTLILSGATTYTGATSVQGGKLVLSGGAVSFPSSGYAISSGAVLEVNATGGLFDFTAGGVTFSGTGTLLKTGGGTMRVPANSGTFNLGAGSLIDIQAGVLDAGSNANENWASNLSSLNIAGGASLTEISYSAARFDALTGSGTMDANGSATVTIGANNTAAGAYNTAGSATFSGNIIGAAAITKTGTGTQTLSGNNTYSGVTNVNNGALLVDGTHSVAGAPVPGLYTVASNATLGGIGATEAPVTVLSGGKLAPGNSFGAGDLGTGNLLLSSGSIFEVNLDGVIAGTQYDQVDVAGSVTVTGSLLDIILGFVPNGGPFTIIDNDGTDAVVGTFSGLPEGSIFFDANQQWMISYLGGTGNDVVLTATPEPSTLVSGLVGLFALAFFAWRERRRISAP